PLDEIGNFLIEDLGGRRIAHVIAFDVMLSSVYMSGGYTLLLHPQPVNIIFEPKPGWKEWRKSECIVVTRQTAIHSPVLFCNGGAEVHQNVDVVQVLHFHLRLIGQEHLHKVNGIYVVGPGTERLSHLYDGLIG